MSTSCVRCSVCSDTYCSGCCNIMVIIPGGLDDVVTGDLVDSVVQDPVQSQLEYDDV